MIKQANLARKQVPFRSLQETRPIAKCFFDEDPGSSESLFDSIKYLEKTAENLGQIAKSDELPNCC